MHTAVTLLTFCQASVGRREKGEAPLAWQHATRLSNFGTLVCGNYLGHAILAGHIPCRACVCMWPVERHPTFE